MKKLFRNKKALTLMILSLTLIAVMAFGGTLAYFTDFDEVTNTFTMGKVNIELDEPNWDEDAGLDLYPGNVRDKDPTVTAKEGKSYLRIRMEIVDGDDKLITDTDRINLILNTLYFDTAFGTAGANIDGTKKYTVAELNTLASANKINKEYNRTDYAFAGIETGKPGVRYYNYVANAGIFDGNKTPADSAMLFSSVVIPKDWHNEEIFDLNGDEYETTDNGSLEVTVAGNGYKLVLKAEAIQASDMTNAAEAFAALNDATGVTIDASGV